MKVMRHPSPEKTWSWQSKMAAPHWGCASCLIQVQGALLIVAGGAQMQGHKDTNFPIPLYINVCVRTHKTLISCANMSSKCME
jgi:hypothetical protein